MEHVRFTVTVDEHISLGRQNQMLTIIKIAQTVSWEVNLVLECPDLPLIVLQHPDFGGCVAIVEAAKANGTFHVAQTSAETGSSSWPAHEPK
jgi:hypothetical protein